MSWSADLSTAGELLQRPVIRLERPLPAEHLRKRSRCSRRHHPGKMNETTCLVRIAREARQVSASLYQTVLNHELAHCRGWRH